MGLLLKIAKNFFYLIIYQLMYLINIIIIFLISTVFAYKHEIESKYLEIDLMQNSYFEMIYNKAIITHLSILYVFDKNKKNPLDFLQNDIDELYKHIRIENQNKYNIKKLTVNMLDKNLLTSIDHIVNDIINDIMINEIHSCYDPLTNKEISPLICNDKLYNIKHELTFHIYKNIINKFKSTIKEDTDILDDLIRLNNKFISTRESLKILDEIYWNKEELLKRINEYYYHKFLIY
jgi:hypothetical protein